MRHKVDRPIRWPSYDYTIIIITILFYVYYITHCYNIVRCNVGSTLRTVYARHETIIIIIIFLSQVRPRDSTMPVTKLSAQTTAGGLRFSISPRPDYNNYNAYVYRGSRMAGRCIKFRVLLLLSARVFRDWCSSNTRPVADYNNIIIYRR